jgi:PAT family beta-lactamase induction signal transducer AmpG
MRLWIVQFLFGLSGGIPLFLTGSTLQVWMTDLHVDIKTIGAFALVGIPYNVKFLWAPLIDRFQLPFLTRRRAWLVVSQVLLIVAILFLGSNDPLSSIKITALLALLVSFMSATQDILIDAYRRETLTEKQMGFGLSLYVTGYRVGMLISGAFALYMVDHFKLSWSEIYAVVSCFIGLGIFAALIAPESEDAGQYRPKTMSEAVIGPFKQFFSQPGVWWIFAFILLYKIGDNLSSAMTAPFVIQHGYSKTEYAAAVKGVGLTATLVGGFVGAWIMARIGLNRSLWIFGVMQALAILAMAWLAGLEKNSFALAFAIACEMFTSGMAVPAFGTFIAFLTNKKFTATQYALLTSLAALPRTVISAPSGWIAEQLGWTGYFLFCAGMAIPGMLLLSRFAPWGGSHVSDQDQSPSTT